jgi:hypothetical protein
MGISKEAFEWILTQIMLLDEEQAKVIVAGMPKPEDDTRDTPPTRRTPALASGGD